MFKMIHDKKGSALVVVIMVMAVGMILGAALLRVSLAETRFVHRTENQSQAYYVARAGAEAVAEHMIADPEDHAKKLVGKSSDFSLEGGEGTVEVKEKGDKVYIVSEATYQGVTQQAILVMTESDPGTGSWPAGTLIAKDKIYTGGNGNATNIDGPIVVGSSDTDAINIQQAKVWLDGEEAVGDEGFIYDPFLVIPDAPKYTDFADENKYPSGLTGNNHHAKYVFNTVKDSPLYVQVNHIDMNGGSIEVKGDGVVHMFINGYFTKNVKGTPTKLAIDFGGNAKIEVGSNAKLYIYIITDANAIFSGAPVSGHMFLHAPDSKVEWNNANDDFKGVIMAKEIELHNQITIEFDEALASGSELEFPKIGDSFTGYTWLDHED